MIETATFYCCTLDDRPIHLNESKTYQKIVEKYGEAFAQQFVVEYEVRLKDDP